MRYDVILFDLDGTINDSGAGITRCVAHGFEKMGRPVPDQGVLDRFVGPPLIAAYQMYGGMTEAEAVEATQHFRERFQRVGWQENRVYEGIAPLLRDLKRAGAYLAIASGKPEIFVRRIAAHFGFDRYFDSIVGIQLETANADKCSLIRKALPATYDPARTAMIGDRKFDMEAAVQMGLRAVGVGYGYGSEEELKQAGAEVICNTVGELADHLLDPAERGRGRFITFEGADGCGKSTQLELARQYLTGRGYEVVTTREPGGCDISESIREVLLSNKSAGMTDACEALLFAAARVEHVERVILPGLAAGRIVLCDRFLDSSFAYQARGRELGDDFIRQINRFAARALPDRTLLFTGDREKITKRLRANTQNPDRIEREADAFVARVHAGYGDILSAEPERVHAIECTRSIDEVFTDVRAELDALLGNE